MNERLCDQLDNLGIDRVSQSFERGRRRSRKHVNSFDPTFLAEARSHLGGSVVLTQSLHSYYSALSGGHNAEHHANALLTNFATRIFCALGDAASAKWASDMCGRSRQTMIGGSMEPT